MKRIFLKFSLASAAIHLIVLYAFHTFGAQLYPKNIQTGGTKAIVLPLMVDIQTIQTEDKPALSSGKKLETKPEIKPIVKPKILKPTKHQIQISKKILPQHASKNPSAEKNMDEHPVKQKKSHITPLENTEAKNEMAASSTSNPQSSDSAEKTPPEITNDKNIPASTNASTSTPDTNPLEKTGNKISMPHTQTLKYQAYINGVANRDAYIYWERDKDQYKAKLALSVVFLGEFSFESQGKVTPYGLQPLSYREVRGSKNYQVDFNYDTKKAYFERTQTTTDMMQVPLDYMSVAFELSAMVQRNLPKVGNIYTFTVADTKGLQTWRIRNLGEENIQLWEEGPSVAAWHFERLPRDAQDKRHLEWWLAESYDWLPAKIKQTEAAGLTFEFSYKR